MNRIVDVNTLFGPSPAASSDLSVSDLGALMEQHQIGAACTLSTVGALLDHRAGNAATRAACAENPRLVPVATVNPLAFYGAHDETVATLGADGFRLVRMFPEIQGWPVDFAPCAAVVRAVAQQGLPVMVDVVRPGVSTRLVRAVDSEGVQLILAAVDASCLAEVVTLMRERPWLMVETSDLLAVGALRQLVDQVGPDRVLFGSGAPSRPVAAPLESVRVSSVPDEASSLILGGNASRLLGLPGTP